MNLLEATTQQLIDEVRRLTVSLAVEHEWRERAERDLKQANEEIGALRYRLERVTGAARSAS